MRLRDLVPALLRSGSSAPPLADPAGPATPLWRPPALSPAAFTTPPRFTAAAAVPATSAADGPGLLLRPPFPREWQDKAWEYWRYCGEARQAVDWLSNAVSRCHLYIGEIPDSGTGDPTPVDDPGVAGEVLAELHDGPIGQAAMLKRLATHLLVPGESWLVGFPDPAEETRSKWAVLSRKEWSQRDDRTVRLKLPEHPKMAPDGWVELAAENVALVAIYLPDAEDACYATSAFEAALATLHELDGLSQRVSADIQSRLVGAGMVPIPESATIPQAHASEGANLHEDPFIAAIIRAARQAIAEPGEPSAHIPIIFRVADESIGGIKHITFATPFDAQIPVLRGDARRTLAADLDIPASVVMGVEDLNHWSAWAVQDDAVRAHIGPLASAICVALTTKILWPTAAAAGDATALRRCVWWDASAITQQPDRSTVVLAAATSVPPIISTKAARRELSFPETDAPEPVAAEEPDDDGTEPPADDDGGQAEPGDTPAPPPSPGAAPAAARAAALV